MFDARPANIAARTRAGCRMVRKAADAGAHGITHDMAPVDSEMIQQAARIFGHFGGFIKFRVVELFAFAVAAVINGNDTKASHPRGF